MRGMHSEARATSVRDLFSVTGRRWIEQAMYIVEAEAYALECPIEFARGVAWALRRMAAIVGIQPPQSPTRSEGGEE